jgi:hypothetical protein
MVGTIYNFQRITSEKLDPKNLVFDTEFIKGTKRVKILYKYDNKSEPKDLHLVLPLDPDSYVIVDALKKDSFKKGTVVTQTSKYSTSFVINSRNPHHVNFYNAINVIVNAFAAKYGKKPTYPLSLLPSGDVKLYTGVIQDAEGSIFTPYYTTEKSLEPVECSRFRGRIALIFSGNTETGKVTSQIFQAFIEKEIPNFPLAFEE